ncbi:hypothetical protein V8C26DRAFT_398799, partial [Trichoderma gracile]
MRTRVRPHVGVVVVVVVVLCQHCRCVRAHGAFALGAGDVDVLHAGEVCLCVACSPEPLEHFGDCGGVEVFGGFVGGGGFCGGGRGRFEEACDDAVGL